MDTQNKVCQENQQHILQMASYLFSKCKISKMSLKYKKMSTSVKLMIAVFRNICLPHIKYIQKHLYQKPYENYHLPNQFSKIPLVSQN